MKTNIDLTIVHLDVDVMDPGQCYLGNILNRPNSLNHSSSDGLYGWLAVAPCGDGRIS